MHTRPSSHGQSLIPRFVPAIDAALDAVRDAGQRDAIETVLKSASATAHETNPAEAVLTDAAVALMARE